MTSPWDGLAREAVAEILCYAAARMEHTAASVSAVQREIDALRWLIKQASRESGPTGLLELSKQPELCARILRERATQNRSRASAANDAYRRFLELSLGQPAAAVIDSIEERLVPRRTRDWDEAERVVGGRSVAPLRACQVLFPEDLLAICEKARRGKVGERALRDEVLVRLHCWSPLRAGEIRALTWLQIGWPGLPEDAPFTAIVRLPRRGMTLPLLIHRQAAGPLARLYAVSRRVNGKEPEGPVFRGLRYPNDQLGSREIKAIVDEAVFEISTHATRRDLLAAYAYYLVQAHGFTAPDLRENLGYSEVKHVRQLLRAHRDWQLNRKVDEMGGPIPGWDDI